MMPLWMLYLVVIAAGCAGASIALAYRPRPARTDDAWNELCAERQKEADELGKLHGQLVGQQAAFAAVSDQVRERNPYGEITVEDVERAKRGILH